MRNLLHSLASSVARAAARLAQVDDTRKPWTLARTLLPTLTLALNRSPTLTLALTLTLTLTLTQGLRAPAPQVLARLD